MCDARQRSPVHDLLEKHCRKFELVARFQSPRFAFFSRIAVLAACARIMLKKSEHRFAWCHGDPLVSYRLVRSYGS